MIPRIAIIGGGASGLTAAIAAKRANPRAQVTLFERNDRVGKKILSTGNGRCNISNCDLSPKHYHSTQPELLRPILVLFDGARERAFFHSLGLCLVEEEGRLYPNSNQASAVLDALRFACDDLGVKVRCGVFVRQIERTGGAFRVAGDAFDRVIVAAGGSAAPAMGTDGAAFALLRAMGHTVTPLHPALVQLKTDGNTKALKGTKHTARVEALAGSRVLAAEEGEILYTDYGLSGIPILQLSHLFGAGMTQLAVNLFPALSRADLGAAWAERAHLFGHRSLEHFLIGVLPKRLAQQAVVTAGLSLSASASSLTEEAVDCLLDHMHRWTYRVTGTNPWQQAQTTAGGALLSEFGETLESKRVPNFYATGELLDVHGDCGGYNLHWAWATGYLAGHSAATEGLC